MFVFVYCRVVFMNDHVHTDSFTREGLPMHGGDLRAATRDFGRPQQGWQDLSTGISPWQYPVNEMPAHVWQTLPESNHALIESAARYYHIAPEFCVPLPGSQYAISQIPLLLPAAKVAIPLVGYQGHCWAWAQAGHQVVFYKTLQELHGLTLQHKIDHIVLINPNNPTGKWISLGDIRKLCEQHENRGLILLDEAFVDMKPAASATSLVNDFTSLVILRSLGKFFGLAGMRLGFLISKNKKFSVCNALSKQLSPWGINHPAQWLGVKVLTDFDWQKKQRNKIACASKSLEQLWVSAVGKHYTMKNSGIFLTLFSCEATLFEQYRMLAKKGILLRWCHLPMGKRAEPYYWLRCGLPGDNGLRLCHALSLNKEEYE